MLRIGSFPYAPTVNPYQRLITDAIEECGCKVERIPPRKFFPLQHAIQRPIDLLHLDWHYDFYHGRNAFTRTLKRAMFVNGLRRLKRIPVVWTAHNIIAHDSDHRNTDLLMTQELVNRCDGIMVMSLASKAELEKHYRIPKKAEVAVVPHGHYADAYLNEISRESAREVLGLRSTDRVWLAVGTVKPYKGHADLVKAFVTGQRRTNDVLLIAGKCSPAERQVLEAIVEGCNMNGARVLFHTEFVRDEDFQVYFNAADIAVLAYRHILNSGALLLAMSFGMPIVARRMGSIPEVGHPDWLFTYDGADDLCQVLESSMEIVKAHSYLSVRAEVIGFTRDRYCWNAIGKQLASLYQSIVSPG